MTDEAPAGVGEPILIVDDEKNIRRTVRMVLEGEGHTVHEAGSIAEADAVLAREAVDVILLDVKLGDDNGLVSVAACLEVYALVGIGVPGCDICAGGASCASFS